MHLPAEQNTGVQISLPTYDFNDKQLLDLAYFTGAIQTDGSIFKFRKKLWIIEMTVGIKSEPMLIKTRDILANLFDRRLSIFKKTNGHIGFHTGIMQLIDTFKELGIKIDDPVEAPSWIENMEQFGAYMGGVIDGDGNVHITRPNYPQCRIRISGGQPAIKLKSQLLKWFDIKSHILMSKGTAINKEYSIAYVLEFYATKKNFDILEKYVIQHISIPHKREKLEKFIKENKKKDSYTNKKYLTLPTLNILATAI